MPLPRIAIIRNVESQKISLPRYGNPVGTSMTLLSAHADSVKIAPNRYEIIETGLSIALPIGLEAQVRSLKQSTQTGVFVMNAPLTIDASDRQDIKVCLYNASNESVIVKYNDPIALLVFSPALRVEWDDMTPKRQIQATQTDAIVRRTQQDTEDFENVSPEPEEFEPLETPETNDIKETEIPVLQDVEITETVNTEQETTEADTQNDMQPVEPPAIVKEFEEMERQFQSTQSDGEKNEN